jgi:hypothetical protein
MESTGEKNRIHLSKSTADLLVTAGKGYWVKPRQDLVHAKGKGNVQTYWLVTRDNGDVPQSSGNFEKPVLPTRIAPSRSRSTMAGGPTRGVRRTTSDSIHGVGSGPDNSVQNQKRDEQREERLIQWQLELFARLLVKIIAARGRKPEAEKQKRGGSWGGLAKATNLGVSQDNLSPAESSLDDDDNFASTSIMRKPVRQRSRTDIFFRMSSIRSTRCNESAEMSIETCESLNENATDADATVSPVEKDIDRIQAPQSHGGAMFDGAFDGDDRNLIVVDEVAEIITLPRFNPKAIKKQEDAKNIKLDEDVVSLLGDFIGTVAKMYRCASSDFLCRQSNSVPLLSFELCQQE